ncbi:Hypothetical predicted protein, partial [Marmota monax]
GLFYSPLRLCLAVSALVPPPLGPHLQTVPPASPMSLFGCHSSERKQICIEAVGGVRCVHAGGGTSVSLAH